MRARLTWTLLRAAFAVAALAGPATEASAQIPGDTIKIGVLSDFSDPFADQVGKGSLVGAQLAAEDFAKEAGGLKKGLGPQPITCGTHLPLSPRPKYSAARVRRASR